MITFTLLLGKLHCSEGRGVGCVGISQGHVLLLAGPWLCFSSAGLALPGFRAEQLCVHSEAASRCGLESQFHY